jgi:hypothetical protein
MDEKIKQRMLQMAKEKLKKGNGGQDYPKDYFNELDIFDNITFDYKG